MADDSAAPSTGPQRSLADYCLFLPTGSRQVCYAQAELVVMRPGGDTLAFSCRAHETAWADTIRGKYVVLERDEWEARGARYRGATLGG